MQDSKAPIVIGSVLALLAGGVLWQASETGRRDRPGAASRVALDAGEPEAAPAELEAAQDVPEKLEPPAEAPVPTGGAGSSPLALAAGSPPAAPPAAAVEETERPAATLVLRAVDLADRPLVRRTLELSLHPADDSGRHLVETVTDGQGGAEVSLSQEQAPSGPFDLHLVERSGRRGYAVVEGLAWRGDRLDRLDRLDLGTVVLETPKERNPVPILSGFVLDDLGQPVVGLRSRIGPGGEGEPNGWPPGSQCVSEFGSDGSFVVYGPAEAQIAALHFFADGYQMLWLKNVELPALDLDLVMPRALTLVGRLVVPAGWPLPDRFGVAAQAGDESISEQVAPDGSFSIDITPRLRNFQVIYPKGAGFYAYTREFPIPAAGSQDPGTVELGEIQLDLHAQRHEFLVLGPDGEPLRNARLDPSTPDQAPTWNFLKTDAEGRYVVILPNETTTLTLARRGEPSVEIDLVSTPERVELP